MRITSISIQPVFPPVRTRSSFPFVSPVYHNKLLIIRLRFRILYNRHIMIHIAITIRWWYIQCRCPCLSPKPVSMITPCNGGGWGLLITNICSIHFRIRINHAPISIINHYFTTFWWRLRSATSSLVWYVYSNIPTLYEQHVVYVIVTHLVDWLCADNSCSWNRSRSSFETCPQCKTIK